MKEFDMEFTRGDTLSVSFDMTDKEGNPLVPTAGDELYFTMKKNYNSSSFILQKKYSAGDFEIVDNTIKFNFLHDDTASLGYGDYVYDIELKSGQMVKTILMGNITLTNEVTWINNE